MNIGDLICDKVHTVVGVINEIRNKHITINVLWNKAPSYQGVSVLQLHEDKVESLPQGTKVIKHYENKVKNELLYSYYDSDSGLIRDITGAGFSAWNVDGSCTLEFEFNEDVSTKNNKQYTQLNIEPWDIMEQDFTREEFIGFLKGNILKYLLRKKGSDLQDFEKIEHYAKKLQEVLKDVSH